jgi:hypothetical protein
LELDLWHHLDDFHGTTKLAGQKRQYNEEESVGTSDAVARKQA